MDKADLQKINRIAKGYISIEFIKSSIEGGEAMIEEALDKWRLIAREFIAVYNTYEEALDVLLKLEFNLNAIKYKRRQRYRSMVTIYKTKKVELVYYPTFERLYLFINRDTCFTIGDMSNAMVKKAINIIDDYFT